MAIVVIGGHSRNIGKTSVMAGLIERLPQFHWTAFKITQYGHGFCTANGEPCDCQTDDHTLAVSEERDAQSGTDSSRYLAAGAARSLWVRTRVGMLAAAMPRIRRELERAENAIIESNSILRFVKPDLYLSVLDAGTADFKESARLFLDRADAFLVHGNGLEPQWKGVSAKLLDGKPMFPITPPEFLSEDAVCFAEKHLAAASIKLKQVSDVVEQHS